MSVREKEHLVYHKKNKNQSICIGQPQLLPASSISFKPCAISWPALSCFILYVCALLAAKFSYLSQLTFVLKEWVQLISHDMVQLDLCVCVFFSFLKWGNSSFFLVFIPSFIVSETVLEVGLVGRLNGFEPEENGCWQALLTLFFFTRDICKRYHAVLHWNPDFLRKWYCLLSHT